jgi:pyridoxamine 5'-phosphate oxidase
MSPDHFEITDDQWAARLWQELARAPHDRHHEWRTPTLATQGLGHGGPQARTVVLRGAQADRWSLTVYTDARSPKCAELAAQPLAQLTFWSKRLHWQLRASALAEVELQGDQVHSAWERMKFSPARFDYLSALPPGHIEHLDDTAAVDFSAPAREHHLAVLTFKVTSMDWLMLSQSGHRRAKLLPDGSLTWLIP